MRILVIPDVHLKPNMFRRASELMYQDMADRAVCLMDIADDWDQQYNIELYEETYDEAIDFAKKHPKTLWCYGNHDLSYIWHQLETGYSSMASYTVQKKLIDLKSVLVEENSIRYVHRIDNVLFSHGGLREYFVREYVSESDYDNVDIVLEKINQLGKNEIWNDASPIWCRPQYSKMKMYNSDKLMQVVGHTPVEKITRDGNIISCDVFSTYRDGRPIGSREYLLIDTETWECSGIV